MLPNIIFGHVSFSGALELEKVLTQIVQAYGYVVSKYSEDDCSVTDLSCNPAPYFHRTLCPVESFSSVLGLEEYRFIYLCRDLRDVSVAAAKNLLLTGKMPEGYDLRRTVESVISNQHESESRKAINWLAAGNVCVVRFEELELQLPVVVERILEFCGLTVTRDEIREAIHLCTGTASSNAYNIFNDRMASVDGYSGQYLEYFDENISYLFNSFLQPANSILGYPAYCDFKTKNKSLFRASRAPYYIFAPNYQRKFAGVRALHYLCHALNESGEEAYVTCDVTVPFLRTPKLTSSIRRRHEESGREPIVLYPEVVYGNPMNGRIVVRWLLNRPGHLSGDTVFDNLDIIFTYSMQFVPEGLSAELLYIPTIDQSIFNNQNNPDDRNRKGVCFYANKYLAKGGILTAHAEGAISLCQDTGLTQLEIAQILRRSELLYVYEPTALIQEALLCGCPVSVVVTDYWIENTNDLKEGVEFGISYGDDPAAISKAKETVSHFGAKYDAEIKVSWSFISRFIELTQQRYQESLEQQSAQTMPRLESHGEAFLGVEHPGQSDGFAGKEQLYRASLGSGGPEIRIFVLAFPGQDKAAADTIESVLCQGYPRRHVTVLTDGVKPIEAVLPKGVVWHEVAETGFISAANDVIGSDDSEWCFFLVAGDRLEPDALSELAYYMGRNPAWSAVYTDEDGLSGPGNQRVPYFKPDFSIDLLRSAPYVVGGLLAVKRSALVELGGLLPERYGAEFYDLILRIFEHAGAAGIGHVSNVLFHRATEGIRYKISQDEVIAARLHALRNHLDRIGAPADVENGVLPGTFRIRYRFSGETTVSIVIPTMNGGGFLQRCIGAIVENTDYKNWEIIVVDEESDDPETVKFLELLGQMGPDTVRVIKHPRSGNLPAMINAGAAAARGQYLLFMADATAPLRNDWLDEMLGYAVQSGVGAVGAKMIGPDTNISFAGYVLGLEGQPAGLHDLHAPPDALGYFGGLQVVGNPSAVSATCMLTSKAWFEELGGFDEQALAGGYSDVDFCLKTWQSGKRVVWTPYALLLQEHMFQPPKAADLEDEEDVGKQRRWHVPSEEGEVMFDRWLNRIAFDPAYNRNLSLASGPYEIEPIPALTWDPEFRPVPRVFALTADQSGSGEYRVIAPLRCLKNEGKVQGWDSIDYLSIPELARMSPDVVLFQRQLTPSQLRLMQMYVRHSKAFRVFELDDLVTNVQLGNLARQAYAVKDLAKRFRQALDMCDRFVVSTDFLAQEFRKFKDEICVAPNYLERARWGGLVPKRRRGAKPRVGWAGGISHVADLVLIADVVKALAGEVEWVFLGLCPDGVRQLVEYYAGVPLADYPAKLASLDLDLALAPLEDVPFNHGKSHLRLLEYGVLGYPVICTDITPYRGGYPVTRVKNRFKDWVEAIREHVSDMDELARRGDALRDYIHANWMLEDNLDTWLKAWLP